MSLLIIISIKTILKCLNHTKSCETSLSVYLFQKAYKLKTRMHYFCGYDDVNSETYTENEVYLLYTCMPYL